MVLNLQQELYNSCCKSQSLSTKALCKHQDLVWDLILQWLICRSSKQVLQVQGGAWRNTQRGNTQKLLITPYGTTTEPGQTWVTVLRDASQTHSFQGWGTSWVSGEIYHEFGPSCHTLRQPTDGEVRMTRGNRAEVTFGDTRKWPGNANCPMGFHTAMRAKLPGELDLYHSRAKGKISSARVCKQGSFRWIQFQCSWEFHDRRAAEGSNRYFPGTPRQAQLSALLQ